LYNNLNGLIVSLLTPMDDDFNVDFFGLKNLVARLMNKGVQNFLALGEFSEYEFLDYSTQKKLIVSISKEINNKGNLIVGCFSDSTDEIIDKVNFAEKYADYCLVNIPFNALTNEVEFVDFFDNLFTRTKSKLIINNNPIRFKRNVPVVGLNRVAGWEKLIGVFDHSKNKSYFKAICDYHQSLKIFQCSEELAIESFNYNCSGNVSVLANVFPELFLNIKKDFDLFGYNSMLRQELNILRLIEKIPLEREIQFYKKMLFFEGIIQEFFSNALPELGKEELLIIENIFKKSVV